MTGAVQGRRAGRSRLSLLGLLATIPVLAIVLAPESRLRCADPWLDARSPDRSWTVTICRRPMIFAMPGGSSDAPGWIVLRDDGDAIRGIVDLGMMQLLAEGGAVAQMRWEAGRVVLPFLADMPLASASGPVSRWLDDRLWRLRALAGLVPSDEMSR